MNCEFTKYTKETQNMANPQLSLLQILFNWMSAPLDLMQDAVTNHSGSVSLSTMEGDQERFLQGISWHGAGCRYHVWPAGQLVKLPHTPICQLGPGATKVTQDIREKIEAENNCCLESPILQIKCICQNAHKFLKTDSAPFIQY